MLPTAGQLAQKLTLREIRDGIVFSDGGQVHIAFDLYLPSSKLITDDQRAVIAEQLAHLVRQVVPIGGRARIYVEAIQGALDLPIEYLEALEAADPKIREINQAKLDALRVKATEGKVRQWKTTLVLSFLPSYSKQGKESFTKEEYTGLLSEVEQLRESTIEILKSAGVHAAPMQDPHLAELFFRYMNPALTGHKPPPKRPDQEELERLLLSSVKNNQYSIITVGGVHVTNVVLHKGPRYTHPGLLDILLSVPGDFILVIEATHLDQGDASAKLNLTRVRLEAVAADMGNRADPELVEKARLMAAALTRRARTAEHIVEVGVQLILRDKDIALLQGRAREAYGKAQSLSDASVVLMPPNALEYWLAASPFFEQPLIRRWSYLDLNTAHLAPLKMPWRGSPNPIAFYLSREGAVVGINPFDPRAPAWNGILVGGTGSGKTFFTQSYITSFLTTGDFVAIIDKGGGYVPLVKLLGGAIIYFQPDAEVTINPFDLPEGHVEPDDAKLAFLVALLKQMIPSRGDPTKEEVILTAAIKRLYRAFQVRRRLPDGTEEVSLKTPTLSDFRRILQTTDETFGQHVESKDREIIQSMAQALALWTGDTPYGQLVDGQTTVNLESKVVYFETTGISKNENLQRVGLLLLMELLWQRIARNPEETKMLIFDEVWSLLGNKEAAGFVIDLYRRLRRYGASALSISQTLGDFVGENTMGIIENANYFFLLSATNQEKYLRDVLKLPPDLISTHARLQPKGELLFLLRAMGRYEGEVLQYVASKYEIAAFGTAHTEQTERSKLEEELGSLDALARYMHLEGLLSEAVED